MKQNTPQETAPFRSPAAVFGWLERFVNLEQGVMPPSMRPERMHIIARAAGNPEKCAPAIHIAGSKGKGSITAMITAIFEEAGFRVGRYMSPHVEDYRERITLGGRYFADEVYIKAGEKLREIESALADRNGSEYQALLDVSDGGAAEATFFELLTLYFFLCAKEAGCTVLVIETGMGGRLDPTNVCASMLSVITGIELEHTDMLGDTIEKIAVQKAGIIKQHTPVIIARQKHKDGSAALRVFRETAAARNAPLLYLPDSARISPELVSRQGTAWEVTFNAPESHGLAALDNEQAALNNEPAALGNGLAAAGAGEPFHFFREGLARLALDGANHLSLRAPVPGKVQAENGTIAALASLLCFPGRVTPEHAKNGLLKTRLPARFEFLRRNPDVVVDGAHTALSVEFCAATWTELYGKDAALIFGCAMGKDVEAMARLLIPCFKRIMITRPGTYKISEPEKIYAVFTRTAEALQAAAAAGAGAAGAAVAAAGGSISAPEIEFIPETEKAIARALTRSRAEGRATLGTGSFYMAAEIRNFIKQTDTAAAAG